MFLYLSIFISNRNHQKRFINVRHLLKVVLEYIVLQRHLVAISVLHLSCKGDFSPDRTFIPWNWILDPAPQNLDFVLWMMDIGQQSWPVGQGGPINLVFRVLPLWYWILENRSQILDCWHLVIVQGSRILDFEPWTHYLGHLTLDFSLWTCDPNLGHSLGLSQNWLVIWKCN